jgi:hypothetical protein
MPEQIDFPESVGDGALTGFHDDAERAADFAEAGIGPDPSGPVNVPQQMRAPVAENWEEQQAAFQTAMEGVAHQGGVQHDLQPKGFTSDQSMQNAQDFQQQEWNNLEQYETIPQSNFQGNPVPDQDFQRMYGQSENEKGELRKRLELAEERERMLQAQLQGQVNPVQAPNFFGPAASPQQETVQAPVQYTNAPQHPQSYDLSKIRFTDKPDGEMILAEDFNQAIRDQVAPYVLDAYNRSQAAEAAAAQAQARLFESQKSHAGITPQIEQAALTAQPWIRNIGDPTAYLGALQNFKSTQDLQTAQQAAIPRPVPQARQAQPAQVQSANPQGQRMLRRTTYVEGAGQRMAGESNQGQNSAVMQWEAAWAATMQLPFGQRAAKQRELLNSRGVNSVSGFRDPNVLTR